MEQAENRPAGRLVLPKENLKKDSKENKPKTRTKAEFKTPEDGFYRRINVLCTCRLTLRIAL